MAVRESVVTIIQARIASTRLPNKALLKLHGRTLLEHVVRRAEQIGYPVMVAIPDDEPLLRYYCLNYEWDVYAGHPADVLDRYLKAAEAARADHVIRVTGDCPLLDPEAARYTVQQHLRADADITYYLAEGRGVEVIKTAALRRAADKAVHPYEREHPDEWLLSHGSTQAVKFSVDTQEDLERVRRFLQTEGH